MILTLLLIIFITALVGIDYVVGTELFDYHYEIGGKLFLGGALLTNTSFWILLSIISIMHRGEFAF